MESNRSRMGKKKLAIAAAIVVPLAMFALILAIPSTTTTISSHIQTPTLEQLTESSDKVLVGTIEKVEVKPYISKIEGDPERGEAVITEKRYLMAHVTLYGDEYLKDVDGDGNEKSTVTFLDYANGCFDALKKDCIEYDLAYSYEVGDKAVFFLNKFDGQNYGTGGYSSVYAITSENQDAAVQSELMRIQEREPVRLDDFKNEIKNIVEKEK